ncbi:TonB-dependent receptor [Piscinibacter aquaticus]|uniref:TonB-dependent receptor n=1 Tax=Piscinibacter aquaticus TaxID=392597 RepID=A0A5C6U2I2_9BURK|nr:TonB-dependent receptor [Piscinibacter aquaticus]
MIRSSRRPSALRGLGLLVASTLPFASFSSFAAEPQSLQPVVVTATRLPQPIDTVLADLRVIDADAIANAGPMSLTELLRIRGGVEISANGGPGQVSGLFIRGSNASHVVLLVDGVRVNSATAGTNAFEHIPLAQIERIEILRGVGSSLYGADAIGGVIQVFTKNAEAERTEASIGLGQWDTTEASVGLARRFGATKLSLQAGWRDSHAFSATNEKNTFSFDPDADGYRNTNLGLNAEHTIAAGHTLALRALASRGRTEFDAGPGTDDVNRQRTATVALESRNQISANWRSLLRRRAVPTTSAPKVPSRLLRHRPGPVHLAERRGGARRPVGRGRGVAAREGRQRHRLHADHAALQRRVRRLHGALRRPPRRSLGAARRRFAVRRARHGQAGVGVKFTPQWRASASVGTAFKAPSFNDLYYPLSFGFSGNPDLKPERARSTELALRHDGGALQGGLTVFDSRVKDLIAIDPSFSTVINVNRARIRGATLDAARRADIWTLRGEFTHQDAEDADTGQRLVRRARQYGSASVGVTLGTGAAGSSGWSAAIASARRATARPRAWAAIRSST